MNRAFRTFFVCESNEYFRSSRPLMILPLAVAGVVLTAYLHAAAPFFAAVAIALLPAMETQFNNQFYRSASELEAMGMLPLDWIDLVRAKNLAALAVMAVAAVPMSIVLGFFAPSVVGAHELFDLAQYLFSVAFVLLQAGNTQSFANPRRISGWRYEDLMEIVWMLVSLAIASVPAMMLGTGLALAGYSLVTAAVWWYRSIPATSRKLGDRFLSVVAAAS